MASEATFQQVLNTLVSAGAERVLVLEGPAPFTLRAAHGMRDHQPWNEQVSLELLQSAIEERAPLFVPDVASSPFGERWSLMLNSVRAVLCVPFWTPSSRIAGIVYADICSTAGVFSRRALEAIQTCARQLEASLYGAKPPRPTEAPPVVAPRGSLGLKAPAAPPPEVAPTPRALAASRRAWRPAPPAVTIFYRSLATMIGAGLPLGRSLDVLCQHQSDPDLRGALEEVAGAVYSGTALSEALSRHPRAFGSLYVQMIRVGEASGSLHTVLPRLADHRERAQQTEMQLRQALSYPALILVLCLILLILGPPYLLEGQFALIRASGQVPPWPTQIVMGLSTLVRNPWFLLALGGGLGLGLAWARRLTAARWWRAAGRVPGLHRALVNLLLARFAGTLTMAYRVGIPLDDAIALAGQSTQSPWLTDYLPQVHDRIREGESLTQSLGCAPVFPPLFLQMLAAGEEAGKIDEMMSWVGQFYELELQSSLDRFLALIEPILLLGMGLLVGFVLIATLGQGVAGTLGRGVELYRMRRAFTLVEVMLGSTLGLMLLGIFVMILIPLVRYGSWTSGRATLVQAAVLLGDRLGSDLQRATLSGVTIDSGAIAIHPIAGATDSGTAVWDSELVLYDWDQTRGDLLRCPWSPTDPNVSVGPMRVTAADIRSAMSANQPHRLVQGIVKDFSVTGTAPLIIKVTMETPVPGRTPIQFQYQREVMLRCGT